jgi:hypothetical protein
LCFLLSQKKSPAGLPKLSGLCSGPSAHQVQGQHELRVFGGLLVFALQSAEVRAGYREQCVAIWRPISPLFRMSGWNVKPMTA